MDSRFRGNDNSNIIYLTTQNKYYARNGINNKGVLQLKDSFNFLKNYFSGLKRISRSNLELALVQRGIETLGGQ